MGSVTSGALISLSWTGSWEGRPPPGVRELRKKERGKAGLLTQPLQRPWEGAHLQTSGRGPLEPEGGYLRINRM